MLYYVAAILYVLISLVLMLVILLQQGKGGDIASAFGGGDCYDGSSLQDHRWNRELDRILVRLSSYISAVGWHGLRSH